MSGSATIIPGRIRISNTAHRASFLLVNFRISIVPTVGCKSYDFLSYKVNTGIFPSRHLSPSAFSRSASISRSGFNTAVHLCSSFLIRIYIGMW
jgi:hypothetical protein